jgi:hypothetical protein
MTVGFLLTCLISGYAAGFDWRDLDPSDENSALRKGIESGKIMDGFAARRVGRVNNLATRCYRHGS